MSAEATKQALAIFDALCERRVSELIDAQLIADLADSLAGPGRAAELVTRFVVPSRTRILGRLAASGTDGPKLGEAIPAGVLEMLIAMLPSIPPPPKDLVASALGSPAVRTEVRRILEETVREAMQRMMGGRGERPRGGVIGWGARAAASAAGNVVGAIGGAIGADLEGRLGDAVELGVALAQKRIVELVSSPENARRVGKELARLVPKLAELPESELARLPMRLPMPILDGLAASLLSHNAARPTVRVMVVEEAHAIIAQLSETSLGELLDRFGAREPMRTLVSRVGGAVVTAVGARVSA